MPYIKQEDRKRLDPMIELLCREFGVKEFKNDGTWPSPKVEYLKNYEIPSGDINYVISSIFWKILDMNKKYKTANDLIGVLECIKMELYRRKISNYEDEKIGENGDINHEKT